jgi:cytochrome b involved in lipid metabolism
MGFMNRLYILVVLGLLLFSGCAGESPEAEPVVGAPGIIEEPDTYSLEEIATHNSENDCWLLIGGKVYDVSAFIPMHPGGSAILGGCGKDATELFETRPMGSGTPHSQNARERREGYYAGDLEG